MCVGVSLLYMCVNVSEYERDQVDIEHDKKSQLLQTIQFYANRKNVSERTTEIASGW